MVFYWQNQLKMEKFVQLINVSTNQINKVNLKKIHSHIYYFWVVSLSYPQSFTTLTQRIYFMKNQLKDMIFFSNN
ncbi:expressed protein [Dictyostelium purpureum]|uniref:Expressed protein n=1 Tax=Dictyostelium purpureum TaxID=5786 RepID=F0ZJ61_DICPU|nr:uncharacterized protein DICPUDRAFT_91916 [Dictyostelium purpureum]EGC36021.1 expressed protein [Dictyostelium purpureum]|eukprot:XP_003287459.1 expressed protein [Dictyostelium purpureum]